MRIYEYIQNSEPFEHWAYVYAQAAHNNLSEIIIVGIYM